MRQRVSLRRAALWLWPTIFAVACSSAPEVVEVTRVVEVESEVVVTRLVTETVEVEGEAIEVTRVIEQPGDIEPGGDQPDAAGGTEGRAGDEGRPTGPGTGVKSEPTRAAGAAAAVEVANRAESAVTDGAGPAAPRRPAAAATTPRTSTPPLSRGSAA